MLEYQIIHHKKYYEKEVNRFTNRFEEIINPNEDECGKKRRGNEESSSLVFLVTLTGVLYEIKKPPGKKFDLTIENILKQLS